VVPPTDDTGALGPWDPLTPQATTQLFGGAPFLWWIAGGLALDLFVGHTTRDHLDTDVSILRSDAPLLRPVLQGWDLQLAHAGVLTPWTTEQVEPPVNSIWCRRDAGQPWCLQVMFEDGTPDEWACRRHPDIRLPMVEAVCHDAAGRPYVAPQIQLFMKAKGTRPKDEADYGIVSPLLSPEATNWLQYQLNRYYPGHPWVA
jgi:hypothetical protein